MNCFWYINQIGILIEVIGALLIVSSAFKAKNKIKSTKDTWDNQLTEDIRDIIANQAFTELKGFGLLAIGLTMQFVGGFD